MENTIEMKELHSITMSGIGAPYAVSWSEDGKVSVITSAALHVIEICPSPSFNGPGVRIKRTMVKPFSDMPSSNTGVDEGALIWKLEQPEVYNMIMDIQIAPNLASSKPLDIRMKRAAWSPAGMFQDRRCLLACLTNLGCVKVLAPCGRAWPVVVDIGSHWINYCKEHWPSYNPKKVTIQSDPQQLFHIMKSRAYKLNASAITWSNLRTVPEKFSFLVQGNLNGEIVVWKLQSVKVSTLCTSSLSPALVVNTDLQRISALHWLNWSDDTVMLIVGNTEGRVKLLQLSVKDDDISWCETTDIWTDKDRMQVQCISSLPSDSKNDTRVIAVTKNSYVIVFLLRKNEVVAKCHQLIGNLNVSGLEVADQDTFIATTHSGLVSLLQISSNDPQEFALQVKDIKTSVNWKKFACYGIAAGVKRGIWVLATSICKLYDHLVIRRPANIILFYLQGRIEPMQSLVQNTSGRLFECWEYLEIIRVQCMKKYYDLYHEYLDNYEELQLLSSYQLQTELWLAKITLRQTTAVSNFDKQHRIGKLIHQLEQLLFCRHACLVITKLLSRSESLNMDQLLTLYLMRSWIQEWLQSENLCWTTFQEIARSKLNLPVPLDMPTKEECSLCSAEVIMNSSWRYAVCKNSHHLPRCSWTLRQCVTFPYLICQVCSAIALPNGDPGEKCVCIFCDSPLFLDDKIKLPEDSDSESAQQSRIKPAPVKQDVKENMEAALVTQEVTENMEAIPVTQEVTENMDVTPTLS